MNQGKKKINNLCILTDHVDPTIVKSFLIEWNHPFREIENLEIKVIIKDNQVLRKCFVCPSEKRGKLLYSLEKLNGKLISGTKLRQDEIMCENFLSKSLYKIENKCFRIFKVWQLINEDYFPTHFRVLRNFDKNLLSFVERVQINLNAKKIVYNHEKMDFHLDENLANFFHSDDEFYMFEVNFFAHGCDRDQSPFLNNLEIIFNLVTHLSFDGMFQRDKLITKLTSISQNCDSCENFIKSMMKDQQMIKDLKDFLKLYVFFEFDGYFEVMKILNYLEIADNSVEN